MPGRFVDAAALGLDDPVLDLIAHAEAVPAADAVGLEHQLHGILEDDAVERDGLALVEADRRRSPRFTATSSRQNATPMIGSTIVMPVLSRSRSLASCVAPSMFESVEYAFSALIW